MFKKILVTLDGSRLSRRALPYATEVAKHFDAEVTLMQVVPPTPLTIIPAVPDGMTGPIETQLAVQAARRQDRKNTARARRYLGRLVRELTAQGIQATSDVRGGSPAKSIIAFSRRNHIDLVVMTTQGKTGLRRAIMGSVADEVIRESGIPVLVIRPQRRRKK